LGFIFIALLKVLYNKLRIFWLKKKVYSIKRKLEKFYWKIRSKWNTSTLDILPMPAIALKAVVSPYTGLVMDRKRKIFPTSAFSNHKIPGLYAATPNNSVITGFFDLATVIQHGPWDNYYHWYIDVVPRIWGLHREDYQEIESIDLLLTKELSKEEEGFLKALLPDNVRLQIVPKESLFQVRDFIFLPFLSQDCYGKLPAEYLNFFLRHAENYFSLKKSEDIKLFITRKLAKKRKFLNEQEVANWIVAQGFELVALEDLCIGDQAQLFYNARIIVAQHGAGLTNLLYCQDAHVIEIFSAPNTHLNHYSGLCEAKQLGYTPIYMNGKHKNDDAYCDIRLVEQALNAVYAEKID
jgi:capsular polysaccharide biosynthesis protein